MKKNIALIGGTIESLATSLHLVKNQYHVDYIEKEKEINLKGRGLILTPRASNSLIKLGVYDKVKKLGHQLNYQVLVNSKGRDYYSYKWNINSLPFLSISEELLGEIFLQEIKNISKGNFNVHYRESYKIKDNHVQFTNPILKKNFDHLIVAEGPNSKIRKELFQIETNSLNYMRVQLITRCPSILDYEDRVIEWWGYGHRFVMFPLSKTELCIQVFSPLEESIPFTKLQVGSYITEIFKDFKGYGIQNILNDIKYQLTTQNNIQTSFDFFENFKVNKKPDSNIHLMGTSIHQIDDSLFQQASVSFDDSLEILNYLQDTSKPFYNRNSIQFLNEKSQYISKEYLKNIGSFRSLFRFFRIIIYKGLLMDQSMKKVNKF